MSDNAAARKLIRPDQEQNRYRTTAYESPLRFGNQFFWF